ncbi:uncharacterized protein LOC128397525 [Panonychus citri]|uniref:uncharacterized protein LOC128397525 n=1 Tax=Panonychus citri TaxID=50023 RepID=UPI0023071A11|nr:uncharacterized protein LOC128397525 [Panonychus citri]XP_053214236.1 uncharacterized protein LOC128397525 [Panonychus citri]XP_053214237.1 uncharacterized protein LOC128397525 [Panonychus citri]XP_053214238.1 uncharacterized protein LOC128397525 [Panonychus citri]
MNPTMNLNLQAMLRYSELLLEPEVKKIQLNDWLDSYNIAKDGHLKHILKKCLPRVDSLEPTIIINSVETDCIYERCDLLLELLKSQESAKELIFEWLTEQIINDPSILIKIDCPNHCVCSLNTLGIGLIGKGIKWPTHLSVKLLKSFNNQQRCALNTYLDLLTVSIESNIDNYYYIEQLFTELIGKLKPADYINLDGTIDDKPEIIFNGISDCLLLRKFLLNHLMVLTRLDLNIFLVDCVDQQLMAIEELASNSIHWSFHPLVDLYLENDSMLLKCLYTVVELQGFIIRNELAAHQFVESFVDSVNHDTGIIIDWLSSDSEIADLTLRFLLIYLKLPNIQTKTSPLVKIFFTQLLTRIENLWRNKLFPYNPSALLKYQEKFNSDQTNNLNGENN